MSDEIKNALNEQNDLVQYLVKHQRDVMNLTRTQVTYSLEKALPVPAYLALEMLAHDREELYNFGIQNRIFTEIEDMTLSFKTQLNETMCQLRVEMNVVKAYLTVRDRLIPAINGCYEVMRRAVLSRRLEDVKRNATVVQDPTGAQDDPEGYGEVVS